MQTLVASCQMLGELPKFPFWKMIAKIIVLLFIALIESHLDDTAKEAEFHIDGYSHITSNRIAHPKGWVILYLRNNFTYKILKSESDKMCSFLAIHINELNLAIMLVHRPPPHFTTDGLYEGQPLEHSFQNIVLNNISSVIEGLGTPEPDIILLAISISLK